jgi:hypothetical protein
MATPENSIKTNIQLFRKDNEFSERFFRVINLPNQLQQQFLWLLNDTFSTSKYFGYFIWDNNLSDLVPFFSREYFASNWTAIFDAFKVAGTFEAYILIIKSALGDDTQVTFEVPSASHLIIKITEPTGILQWSAYSNDEFKDVYPAPVEENKTLVFSKALGDLTVNETLKLIELLNVNGIFVEVDFGAQPLPTISIQPTSTGTTPSGNFSFNISAY